MEELHSNHGKAARQSGCTGKRMKKRQSRANFFWGGVLDPPLVVTAAVRAVLHEAVTVKKLTAGRGADTQQHAPLSDTPVIFLAGPRWVLRVTDFMGRLSAPAAQAARARGAVRPGRVMGRGGRAVRAVELRTILHSGTETRADRLRRNRIRLGPSVREIGTRAEQHSADGNQGTRALPLTAATLARAYDRSLIPHFKPETCPGSCAHVICSPRAMLVLQCARQWQSSPHAAECAVLPSSARAIHRYHYVQSRARVRYLQVAGRFPPRAPFGPLRPFLAHIGSDKIVVPLHRGAPALKGRVRRESGATTGIMDKGIIIGMARCGWWGPPAARQQLGQQRALVHCMQIAARGETE